MRAFPLSAAASVLLASSTYLFAANLTFNAYVPTVPATPTTADTLMYATGTSMTAYYYGFSALDVDEIDIFDVTRGTQTGDIFINQTSGNVAVTAAGASATLATGVNDLLVVELINETDNDSAYYSGTGAAPLGAYSCTGITSTPTCVTNPSSSQPGDALDHAYITPILTGGTIPGSSVNIGSGLLVGMEDWGIAQNSDWDYNDDQLILTGASTTPDLAPEPGSIVLLGTGLLGLVGIMCRRPLMVG